ncbi:MAG: aminoacyl-tRNA hydrolase [Candidatus Gribaldobacteria bacterium]|nr:aminoacyl-tRNA hydrolase [Candidatus Gribaldobacteria bacterium]
MILIVGLGNPGFRYKKTRHNIGFMAIEALQKENSFSKFKLNRKAKAEISNGQINGQEIFLAKPQTFMNNSGEAVKFLTKENGFTENSLIVVHDDFDLPLGEVKVSQNSGSAGHHGAQSIIEHLKTQNFTRVRIGIRPADKPQGSADLKAESFVLKKFAKNDEQKLAEILTQASQAIKNII